MFEFRGVDFMEFDSLLSEEELLVRQTARQFVEDRFIPQIRQHFRDGTFPNELTAPIAELGFFGANLEGYGCAGLSNVENGLVMQELERGDTALRSFVSVQSSLAMYAIYSCGSDEQKERWLPKMQQGQVMGCFALTEPNFGSNPSVSRGNGHAGVHGRGPAQQAFDACLDNVERGTEQRPDPGREHSARRKGTEGRPGLPDQRQAGNRLGHDWGGHGLL